MSVLKALLALLLVTCIAGCAFDQPVDPAPDALPSITDASIGPVTAEQLFPLQPRRGQFVTAIDRELRTVAPFSLVRRDDRWTWSVEGLTITHIAVTGDGDYVITSEDDLIEGVRVTYDPALIMLPRELAAGQTYTSTSDLHVTDLDTGASRERGRIASRITLEGLAAVTTAAGTFDAHLVRTDRRMNFGVAEASVRLDSAYIVGRGLVWERLRQRLRVLGVAGEITERLISLSDE